MKLKISGKKDSKKNGAANLDEYQPWYDISSDVFWMAMGNEAIKGTQAANATKLAELYKKQKGARAALETATTVEEIATATENLNNIDKTIKGLELAGKAVAAADLADDVSDAANILSGTGSVKGSVGDVSIDGNTIDNISDIADTGAKAKYVDNLID